MASLTFIRAHSYRYQNDIYKDNINIFAPPQWPRHQMRLCPHDIVEDSNETLWVKISQK